MTNDEKSTVLETARATLRDGGGSPASTLDLVTNPDPDNEMAQWLESHVAKEVAAEHEFVMQIVAGALGEFSAQLRAEVGRTIASKLGHAKGPKASVESLVPSDHKESPAFLVGRGRKATGPAGKLPLVRVYQPEAVHYEGDVVVHSGATWQALRDTGRAPPHAGDWICPNTRTRSRLANTALCSCQGWPHEDAF